MHDIDGEHFHADGDPEAEQAHPFWRSDRIVLRSVGIDIGSSTSHLIFSTLELRRQSAVLSSRFELVQRRIDHASEILLTPFVAGQSLDVARLSAFVDASFTEAGIGKADIDTGAVITTGDAARKDNAEAVVRAFSEQAGKFVSASAGPLLEAKMAAYGSGAVARSAEVGQETVLNIDIGGGTSKLAIVAGGRVLEATAINVGARLVTFDEYGRLTKVERAAEITARHRGLELEVGAILTEKMRLDLAASLVDALLDVATATSLSELARELLIAEPLRLVDKVMVVTFSGGVSEYFYKRNVPAFGDIGPQIARLLRQRIPKVLKDIKIEEPAHGIRATVIGASQFTAQVSGNTLFIPNPALLPLRNVQVVVIDCAEVPVTVDAIGSEVRRKLASSERHEGMPVAIALRWPHGPAYAGLNALARGVADATADLHKERTSIVLVIDIDVARLVGSLLARHAGNDANILCIDGIDLQQFDYIDIGEPHEDSGVVTVTVKSLIFTG